MPAIREPLLILEHNDHFYSYIRYCMKCIISIPSVWTSHCNSQRVNRSIHSNCICFAWRPKKKWNSKINLNWRLKKAFRLLRAHNKWVEKFTRTVYIEGNENSVTWETIRHTIWIISHALSKCIQNKPKNSSCQNLHLDKQICKY